MYLVIYSQVVWHFRKKILLAKLMSNWAADFSTKLASRAYPKNGTEVGAKPDFVDSKMMMMGTMIPSFLRAAKPFRKYETTAASAQHQR